MRFADSDGIGIHADMAAINVNCWLADDEHNLEPERGGLVVWPQYPPRDWTFQQYNLIGEVDTRQVREGLILCPKTWGLGFRI